MDALVRKLRFMLLGKEPSRTQIVVYTSLEDKERQPVCTRWRYLLAIWLCLALLAASERIHAAPNQDLDMATRSDEPEDTTESDSPVMATTRAITDPENLPAAVATELPHTVALRPEPTSNGEKARWTASSLALLDAEILFGFGAVELTHAGLASLDRLITNLSNFDAILSIRVIGHTDNTGASELNQQLSLQRANWIASRFRALYPETQLSAIGAGESTPLVSNATREGRERNRRVEIQVIATGKPSL